METIPRYLLESLLEEAIALPPDRRSRFLDRALADDPSLRRMFDELVDGIDTAPSILDQLGRKIVRNLLQAARASGGDVAGMPRYVSHFRLTEKLGEGGMGVIYKGFDTHLERFVALKFLQPALRSNRDAKTRFIQEAKAACGLDHPNIATIYEMGTTEPDSRDPEGQPFIVMAYYDGVTLQKMIEDGGPLAPIESLEIAWQIADGLDSAHEHYITHRDIKPANLMMTPAGRVKILDFGLAKIADACITTTGAAMGSAPYMSPEQTRGEAVDHRTDIWSLGVVLYEMLTGQRPFRGEYEPAVVYSILQKDPAPMRLAGRDIPLGLHTIVDRCLSKDPDARYQTVSALQRDMRSVMFQLCAAENTSPENHLHAISSGDGTHRGHCEFRSKSATDDDRSRAPGPHEVVRTVTLKSATRTRAYDITPLTRSTVRADLFPASSRLQCVRVPSSGP